MLYDPKWEKPADVFSLESLIAWLEKMPSDGTYNYCLPNECLIAQYLKAQDIEEFVLLSGQVIELGWIEVVNPKLGPYGNSFGVALERARKLQATNSSAR